MPKQHKIYREPWWTKKRVIDGLQRFYRDIGFAPTSTEEWQRQTAGTVINRTGVGNPYPSFYGVLKHFTSFREAWTAVGVKVNRDWEPWRPEEDWFIAEGAGILTRKQLAEALDRTQNAVHRRLYDLGIDSYKARGWTFYRVMRVTGVPDYTIRRYADRGDLPYFRGSKCCYIDPADLLVIKEIDWQNPPAELAEAVRRSLITRLVKILRGEDWRAGRLYQVHRTRTTNKTHKRNLVDPEPKPVEIGKGDWIKVKKDLPARPGIKGRVGLVHIVYWSSSPKLSEIRRKDQKAGWVARVEFKSAQNGQRFNRILPLEILSKITK